MIDSSLPKVTSIASGISNGRLDRSMESYTEIRIAPFSKLPSTILRYRIPSAHEGIHHHEPFLDDLPMLEVFRVESATTAFQRRGYDHRVVYRKAIPLISIT
jgi:hypothetical protein